MISLRLSPKELERLDELVASGAHPSRAAALKDGLFLAWKKDFNERLVAELREAYERMPETDEEQAVHQAFHDAAARSMAHEEAEFQHAKKRKESA